MYIIRRILVGLSVVLIAIGIIGSALVLINLFTLNFNIAIDIVFTIVGALLVLFGIGECVITLREWKK